MQKTLLVLASLLAGCSSPVIIDGAGNVLDTSAAPTHENGSYAYLVEGSCAVYHGEGDFASAGDDFFSPSHNLHTVRPGESAVRIEGKGNEFILLICGQVPQLVVYDEADIHSELSDKYVAFISPRKPSR